MTERKEAVRATSWKTHFAVKRPETRRLSQLRGQRFGELRVVSKLSGGHCLFQCSCGKYKIYKMGQVRAGRCKSCGCLRRKSEDMTGETFGRLTVLAPAPSYIEVGRGQRASVARCDCGNEIIVANKSLKSGNTLSCGCLRSEVSSSIAQSLPRHRDGRFARLPHDKEVEGENSGETSR